jgi:Protein of unknown function (DUF1064)
MAYRYTERELADIQARQNVNLSNFQRNSGRGLPKETVRTMELAQGVKLDSNGAPLPVPLPQKRAKKRKSAKPLAETIRQPKHPVGKNPPLGPVRMRKLENEVLRSLEAGEKSVSIKRPAIGVPRIGNHAAPAIARYRKRAECDGIQFDSQLEMRRYKELKLLKAAGEIKYFLRQVPFHLPGGITARVDFGVVYPHFTEDGELTEFERIEYEDCKAGMGKRSKGRYNDADRVGVNKRKQIKALYGVVVKLVTKARA